MASIIFNVYLLYLVKNHSTFKVKLYKWLIAIDASLDLFLSVMCFIVQPTVFFARGYSIFLSNGFFFRYSRGFLARAFTLWAVIMHANMLWIPLQFIFRYRLFSRKNRSGLLFGDYAICTVAGLYAMLASYGLHLMYATPYDIQEIGLKTLELNGWPMTPERRRSPLFGSHRTEAPLLVWLAVVTFTCVGGALIVLWCELKMSRSLSGFATNMHETTKRMHLDFNRALLAMAICPIITSLAPTCILLVLCSTEITPGSWTSLIVSAVTSITMFNPLTTIFFMRCYRERALKLIPRMHRNVHADQRGYDATVIDGMEISRAPPGQPYATVH